MDEVGSSPDSSVLSLRFDVDSVTCLERGIPLLLRLGRRRGVRFTFFVNMGRSYSWRFAARRLRSRIGLGKFDSNPAGARPSGSGPERCDKLSAIRKIGWMGAFRTVFRNPRLGHEYRRTLDELHAEGHELGLHGGTNHAVWQRGFAGLDDEGLERLFRPAFDDFIECWGMPAGFTSPGFRYDERVNALLDREGFTYASDMPGDAPFRPRRSDGSLYSHFQVPVNVVGDGTVPVIEQGLARGHSRRRIVRDAVRAIRARRFALMYDHPFVAGVHWGVLDDVLREIEGEYEVVPMIEYLRRWKEERAFRA